MLGRFFIQLGRKRREQPREDLVTQAGRRSSHAVAGAPASVGVNDILGALLRGDPLREQKTRAFTGYWLERQTHLELAKQFGVAVSTIHRWPRQVRGAFSKAIATSA